jgi:ACS family pantothenate transporter-like MFS transporter
LSGLRASTNARKRQEDLSLYGNELKYMQILWTVGYVIGETPSNMILTRVRPSVWIPALEVIWTIPTFCTSRCNTAQQLYAVRFLVGLAESGFYPGMQYLIGSRYRTTNWPSEAAYSIQLAPSQACSVVT